MTVVELGPREAQHEQRCAEGLLGDGSEQLEERRLCAVDVVEDDDERDLRRDRLEQPADVSRPGLDVDGQVCDVEEARHRDGDRVGVVVSVEEGCDLLEDALR